MQKPIRSGENHFFFIDFARGIAAIAVIFWHYQHFYYTVPGIRGLSLVERQSEPLHVWLFPLFDYGYSAVQFFWIVSGFVFAAVYIRNRVSTREFVINRLARLYPLHFLTLCIVAVLQFISINLTGEFQIFPFNDVYHFILQIFFASFWGIQKGPSFNHPIWSVSVEVLVYALFWITLPFIYRKGIWGPAFIAAIAWCFAYIYPGHLNLLRQCVFYFFSGAVLYLFFDRWRARPYIFFCVAALLAMVTIITIAWRWDLYAAVAMPCMFVAVVLGLCGLEAMSFGKYLRRVRWVGDSTYGIYLWHVPVQIVVLLVFSQIPGARRVVSEPWFLAAFLLTVIGMARLSFLYFERPMRALVRRRAGKKQPVMGNLSALEEMAAP